MRGWRGKIGLLVPSINSTMEPDFQTLAPKGVTIHVTRLHTHKEGTFSNLRDMVSESTRAAVELISHCRPNVVCYGCTSASFLEGPEGNADLERTMTEVSGGIPSATTTSGMVEGLKELGVTRVAVITPYVKATNERLASYLAKSGINVVSLKSFEVLDMYDHANIPPFMIYRLAKEADTKEADGLFVSCTQLPAIDVIEALEADLGKPVITATQATMWLALKRGGIRVTVNGYGELMRRI